MTEEAPSPIVRATGLAYVAFRIPDLDVCAAFLADFGMRASERHGDTLYTAGYGASPYLHRATLGEPAFEALGIAVADLEDLSRLAEAEGAIVRPIDAPGGGWRTVLTDPDGFRIEVVTEQADRAATAADGVQDWNTARETGRIRKLKRIASGPAHIHRLGHCVLMVSDFRASEAWYKSRFGVLTSDDVEDDDGVVRGAFMRPDLGDQPTDHHCLVLAQRDVPPSYNHAAFEVRDLDDLMAGHDHLRRQDHRNHWGVGRHIIGSQVFDYWFDPFGNQVELWTDGDLLTSADPPGKTRVSELRDVQWGASFPTA